MTQHLMLLDDLKKYFIYYTRQGMSFEISTLPKRAFSARNGDKKGKVGEAETRGKLARNFKFLKVAVISKADVAFNSQ